jgi:APA family basic amino acid/polyamine antiporter
VLAASLGAIAVALGTNLIGMKVGKWTENIGGASAWLIGIAFAVLGAIVWSRRGSATPLYFLPERNWTTVTVWADIAYAMSGLELAAMMSAEVRDPSRTLPRAAWLSSACATAFYAMATVALVVLLPAAQISRTGGLSEAADEAGRTLGLLWLAPVLSLLVVASGLGQLGGIGAGVSRLPFAAGADRLLPGAFARVHPRWHTPHVSILALGAVAAFLLVVMQLGDSMRAAYEALVSLMIITGFLPYLYIFGSSWKAGNRWSALAGWAAVTLTIVCAVIPGADSGKVWLFETKLAAGTAAVVGSGWAMYRRRSL